MAISPNFSNIFEILSFIAPFLLGFFLVMSSLFNQDVKGLVYIAGVLIACVINLFLMNMVKETSPRKSLVCDVFKIPLINISDYVSPAPTSMFIAFTSAYLLLPMIYNKQMNYAILVSLLCLGGIEATTNILKECTSKSGALLGTLVGVVLGSLWYTLFHMTGNDSLLYFDELRSNRVVCSRPSKQSFKCSVYKGGQLISSNVV
jgi:hypothetical protein